MELKTKYKFIHFRAIPHSGKSYECVNNRHGDILGKVTYEYSWKQYIFEPEPDTTFSVDCLQDIIHFIGQLK